MNIPAILLPIESLSLSGNAIRVLAALAAFEMNRKRFSTRALSETLKISRQTLKKCIDELQDNGFIVLESKKKGRSGGYKTNLFAHTEWMGIEDYLEKMGLIDPSSKRNGSKTEPFSDGNGSKIEPISAVNGSKSLPNSAHVSKGKECKGRKVLKAFSIPTLAEVIKFAEEHDLMWADPQEFHRMNEERGWVDGNQNPIRNWQIWFKRWADRRSKSKAIMTKTEEKRALMLIKEAAQAGVYTGVAHLDAAMEHFTIQELQRPGFWTYDERKLAEVVRVSITLGLTPKKARKAISAQNKAISRMVKQEETIEDMEKAIETLKKSIETTSGASKAFAESQLKQVTAKLAKKRKKETK